MASYPSIKFPNDIVPQTFNKNSFVSKALKSDDILTSSLNVLGPSTLNTLQSNTINNTSSLTSNTITSASTLTASNGFTVTAGTVSFPANAIGTVAVSGLGTTLGRLNNLTGSAAVVSTITSNILTINYSSNNGQTIFVTPTANFSLVLTNVSTSTLQAIYKLEIHITSRFYCTGITVNGTSLTMVAVGGFANIASQINASATSLIQTFTIFFTGTTTPSKVVTEVLGTW
jgi:hypothetical protein